MTAVATESKPPQWREGSAAIAVLAGPTVGRRKLEPVTADPTAYPHW